MEAAYKDTTSGLVTLSKDTNFAISTGSPDGGWRLNTYSTNTISGQFFYVEWGGTSGYDRQCVVHLAAPVVIHLGTVITLR
jgi:hypothetical protein